MTTNHIPGHTKIQTKIAVCIATCFRPDGLRRLLDGISRQTFNKCDEPEIRIVVVDNDAEGSSKQVCEEFAASSPIPLTYDIEPQRGIPFARNRSVDLAMEDTHFIAIIDDDEVPSPFWIDELYSVQQRYQADAVTGPARPHFVETPPVWAIKGRFYEKAGMPTGQVLIDDYDYLYTGNFFARAEVFHKVRFSEKFGLSGADDTHLFMQIDRAGFKTVWANEALVTEWLPASRTNARWLFQRAFRGGNGFALCEIAINPALHVRMVRGIKGLVHLARGLVLAGLSIGRKVRLIKSLEITFLGTGMIVGVLGKRYDEYKTVHRV